MVLVHVAFVFILLCLSSKYLLTILIFKRYCSGRPMLEVLPLEGNKSYLFFVCQCDSKIQSFHMIERFYQLQS